MKRIGLALARLLDKLGWFEPEFIEHRFDRQDAIRAIIAILSNGNAEIENCILRFPASSKHGRNSSLRRLPTILTKIQWSDFPF